MTASSTTHVVCFLKKILKLDLILLKIVAY